MTLRSRFLLRLTLLSVSLLVTSASLADDVVVQLQAFATGLNRPVGITHAGDGSGRLFILEQDGAIRIHDGTQLLATPFLDLGALVSCCGERGLLGLAFHPQYASNGYFYVNYTDNAGDTVVARYSVSANPNLADAGSALQVLTIDQPFGNHNGGHLAFGADGYLYIGTGDGGSGGDPGNRAQNLGTWLGKMLRIDVDGGSPYAIPLDNPFVATPGALPEIWARGLRNPWRYSFDRLTGDLFIGDVGQNVIEEIDFQPSASTGGENYGWRLMEGSDCFNPSSGCNDGSLVLPIAEYSHASGCSVTGGYRYRGSASPELDGHYLYGDYCSGQIWSATESGGTWSSSPLLASGLSISSFGEDENGELYVADLGFGSSVYRIEALPACNDGIDNELDGLVDFPDDPGCADAGDESETGPILSFAATPACSTNPTENVALQVDITDYTPNVGAVMLFSPSTNGTILVPPDSLACPGSEIPLEFVEPGFGFVGPDPTPPNDFWFGIGPPVEADGEFHFDTGTIGGTDPGVCDQNYVLFDYNTCEFSGVVSVP